MRTFIITGLVFAVISFLLVFLPIGGMMVATPIAEFISLFGDNEVLSSIILTFETALYATLFALIFGTPLSYLLARYRFRGKSVLEALINLPIIIPHTAAGIALLMVFGSGYLGNLFNRAGIDFIGTRAGISLAMAFVSIPFYLDTVREGFRSIDQRIENVARTLGANQRQVFFRVMLPLASPSIFTGSVLMWGRGISEFGAVVILAYHPMIAPVLIYERFTSFGLQSSRPVALLLILLCVIIFILLRIISRLWMRYRA